MTAPTVTEAEAIGKARHTFRRVIAAEWPAGQATSIAPALEELTCALETYRDLLAEPQMIHPAAAFPELEGDDDAHDRALSMAAQDAAEWAAELDRLVPEDAEVAA